MNPIVLSEYEEILKILHSSISKLNNKSILITGATGLIGFYLTSFLIYLNYNYKSNIDIWVTSSSIQKLYSLFENETKNLHFIEHNFTKPIQKTEKFDYVIHAASPASPDAYIQIPVDVMKVNLIGTMSLLDNMINTTGRFLLISSSEIYGTSTNTSAFTEKDNGCINVTDVRSCYPESKRAAETLCYSYARQYDLSINTVRLCHTYGPNISDNNQRADAQFLRAAIKGEDIVLNSYGQHIRSWCYVADTVSGILQVLLSGSNNETYNIANPKCTSSILEYAEMLAKIAKVGVQIMVKPEYSINQNKNSILDATDFI